MMMEDRESYSCRRGVNGIISSIEGRLRAQLGELENQASAGEEIRKEANRLLKGKSSYQQIEMKTGVPWWFVGLCHYREGSGRGSLIRSITGGIGFSPRSKGSARYEGICLCT